MTRFRGLSKVKVFLSNMSPARLQKRTSHRSFSQVPLPIIGPNRRTRVNRTLAPKVFAKESADADLEMTEDEDIYISASEMMDHDSDREKEDDINDDVTVKAPSPVGTVNSSISILHGLELDIWNTNVGPDLFPTRNSSAITHSPGSAQPSSVLTHANDIPVGSHGSGTFDNHFPRPFATPRRTHPPSFAHDDERCKSRSPFPGENSKGKQRAHTPRPIDMDSTYDLTPLTRRDLAILKDEICDDLEDRLRMPSRKNLLLNPSGKTAKKGVFGAVIHDMTMSDEDATMDADTEEEGRDSPVCKRRKGHSPVKHRTPRENAFHAAVRTHGRLLMHRETASSPFSPICIPSAREVETFNPEYAECCTADSFKVDLEGHTHSTFNKSSARVFAQDFKDTYPQHKFSLEEIKKHWLTHVSRLQMVYRKQVKLAADPRDREVNLKEAKHRRSGRKSNLLNQRIYAARHMVGSKAARMIEQFGVSGMSTDESEHEAGRGEPTYFVLNKTWRAKRVTTFFRLLDSLYLHMRYSHQWTRSQGAWPRFRAVSLRDSVSAPASGLPRNCYEDSWFRTKNNFQLRDLGFDQKLRDFDFSIDEKLIQIANQYNLGNRKVVNGQRPAGPAGSSR